MKNIIVIILALAIGGAIGTTALFTIEHPKTLQSAKERDTLVKSLSFEKSKVEALSRKPEFNLLSSGEIPATGEMYAFICKMAVGGEDCDVLKKKVGTSTTERVSFSTLYPLAASENVVKVLALANNYVLLSESLNEPPHTEVTALRYVDGSTVHYSGIVKLPVGVASSDILLFTKDSTTTLSFTRLSLDGVVVATSTLMLPPDTVRDGFEIGKVCKDDDYECLAVAVDNSKVSLSGKKLALPVIVHKKMGEKSLEKTVVTFLNLF